MKIFRLLPLLCLVFLIPGCGDNKVTNPATPSGVNAQLEIARHDATTLPGPDHGIFYLRQLRGVTCSGPFNALYVDDGSAPAISVFPACLATGNILIQGLVKDPLSPLIIGEESLGLVAISSASRLLNTLTDDGLNASFTSDGRLCYVDMSARPPTIIFNGKKFQTFDGPTPARFQGGVAVSPDGKFIITCGSIDDRLPRYDGFHFWIINTGNGHTVMLPSGLEGQYLAWHPTEYQVVYRTLIADDSSDIKWLRLDHGGNLIASGSYLNDPKIPANHPRFSPDGQWLGYAGPNEQLYKQNLVTGYVVQLTTDADRGPIVDWDWK